MQVVVGYRRYQHRAFREVRVSSTPFRKRTEVTLTELVSLECGGPSTTAAYTGHFDRCQGDVVA